MNYSKVLLVILIIVVINEIFLWSQRMYYRHNYFKLAKNRALEMGKPLMVIGNPDSGYSNKIWGRSYDHGDVTLDLKVTGDYKVAHEGDLHDTLPTYNDDSHIIFISYTLEYIPNLERILPHIFRVAGSTKNIFVVTAQRTSLWAYLKRSSGLNDPDSVNIITHAPPKYPFIKFISN
jgi:hypothetical protein